MKKNALIALLAVVTILSLGLFAVQAQEAETPKAIGVTITGVNYGLLNTLAKDELAVANDSAAQLNALKVTVAKDGEGNEIADLAGKTLHYLHVKPAEAAMTGEANRGKELTITGSLFKNESALLVERITSGQTQELTASESVGVIVTGVNYGLLDVLAKNKPAGDDEFLVQVNGLKVTGAKDVEGNEIEGLVGKTLHYLPIKYAGPIMAGEQSRGKEITIIGLLFKNENALLVEEFGADDADDWDDLPVGSMSGLQVL